MYRSLTDVIAGDVFQRDVRLVFLSVKLWNLTDSHFYQSALWSQICILMFPSKVDDQRKAFAY
jgi:hypothetical protein